MTTPPPQPDAGATSGEFATNRREVAILVGLQASGKSTFYRQRLAGTHAHVSKDTFRNARRPQRRQMRLVEEALAEGRDVAVDNTNPSPEEWGPLIEMARRYGARVIAYWFAPDVAGSLERNAVREPRERVPDVGIYATLKRLRRPSRGDGFDEVYAVSFDGGGGFDVAAVAEEDENAGTDDHGHDEARCRSGRADV